MLGSCTRHTCFHATRMSLMNTGKKEITVFNTCTKVLFFIKIEKQFHTLYNNCVPL